MKFLTSMLILTFLWALSGCALRPLASPETDALAKLMRPVEGRALIYIFRNEESSAPWLIGVTLDGQDMGSTAADTYFRWSVEPGQHIIVSHSENDSGLVLQTEPGKIYYVWQDVSTGYGRPRATLVAVDRTTTEIALRSCSLLASRT
jgi:hypothetical protein